MQHVLAALVIPVESQRVDRWFKCSTMHAGQMQLDLETFMYLCQSIVAEFRLCGNCFQRKSQTSRRLMFSTSRCRTFQGQKYLSGCMHVCEALLFLQLVITTTWTRPPECLFDLTDLRLSEFTRQRLKRVFSTSGRNFRRLKLCHLSQDKTYSSHP
jgi:hypothetical protein